MTLFVPGPVPGTQLDELLSRATALAGTAVAYEPHGHKGAAGEAVERALGVNARNEADADFPELGVELKTLPVSLADGRVRVLESTWVASAVPATLADETWRTSLVKRKLAHVLFVPIADGRVQRAFLWSPTEEQERVLRADWEDLADLVANGLGFAITARRGTALQLRPKAANASERSVARTVDGDDVVLPPQGFYLRRTFTQQIVDALPVVSAVPSSAVPSSAVPRSAVPAEPSSAVPSSAVPLSAAPLSAAPLSAVPSAAPDGSKR